MFYESILWTIIFTVTLLIFLAGIVYLVTRVSRFESIKRITKDNKKLKLAVSVLILLTAIILLHITLGYVNAVVVIISLLIFWILSEVVVRIVERLKGRTLCSRIYLAGTIALIVTALYLSVGWYNDRHVVETYYHIDTEKAVDKLRIVQITDSHLGTTFDGEGFVKWLDKIQKCNPDVVLITGDYVDGGSSYEDIVAASKALGKLKTTYGVYYSFGNHDRNFYELKSDYTEEQLIGELKKNNVVILKDEMRELPGGYILLGREDASVMNRMPIEELVENTDKNRFIIDMNHQPNDYNAEEKAGVDLVLSGHTHGGQLFPINNVGIWIGANDKIYGREKRSNTEFVVSSGISDWAIDFKTGCKSEYVVIDIE